jgi:hypothetical protein
VGLQNVIVVGNTLTGADAGNYNLVQQQGLSATISKAGLTVNGVRALDKVYDATPNAVLAGVPAVNALGRDVVTLGGSASANFADSEVGVAKAVTVTGYTLSGADAGNYALIQPVGLKADITALPVTVPVLPVIPVVPVAVSNATTQLVAAVITPAMLLEPGTLSVSPTITLLPALNVGPVVADEVAPAIAGAATAGTGTTRFMFSGASLQIIGSGVRLPGNIANLND